MPELLLYAGDPTSIVPALAPGDLASRIKLFDLVDWHPDGWAWGEQELKSPLFRISVWPNVTPAQCDQLLGPTLATLDSITHLPTVYDQPRAFFLNLADPRVAAEMPGALAYWADMTRAAPSYTVPASMTLAPSDVMQAHPAIAVAP